MATAAIAAPHAFPVPFVPKNGDTVISFTNLPESGTIKIYTINGEEVAHLVIPPNSGITSWPVVNSEGKKLATGVYLFHVEGGGQKSTGKIVVIR